MSTTDKLEIRLAGPEDIDVINSILQHPDIWENIAGDVEPFDTPFMHEHAYFIIGDNQGLVIYHKFLDGVKIHTNILPEKRHGASYEAINETMQHIFDLGITRIYAEIDDKFPNVIKAAIVNGFSMLSSDERNLFVKEQ